MSSKSTPKLSLPIPSFSLPSASPSSPRTRSASLSQARSPSATNHDLLPDASHPPHNAYSPSHAHAHAHVYSHSHSHSPSYPHGPAHGALLSPSTAKSHRKVMSLHHLPMLSPSSSDGDHLHVPAYPPSPSSRIRDEDEADDENDSRGMSRARRDRQRDSNGHEPNGAEWDDAFPDRDDEMVALVTELELDHEGEGSSRYDGPFQAMDAREVVGIVISVGVVLLLAVSAGLTTIYDWVL